MKQLIRQSTVTVCSLVAVVVLATGCASTTGTERAASAAGSLDSLVAALKGVDGGIDQALQALDALVSKPGDDVKAQFEAYKTSVTALEGQAKTVSGQAAAVKARGEEYFNAWQESSAELTSDEAREHSEARRTELGEAYGDVRERALQLSQEFQPFLKTLQDLQGFLALDLTASGFQSVSDTVTSARAAGASLKEQIAALVPDLEKVQKLLSPTAGT